jgi:hypothetical protein
VGDPAVCAFEVPVGVGHVALLPAGVLVGGCDMQVLGLVPGSLPEFVLLLVRAESSEPARPSVACWL